MIPYESLRHHEASEELVKVLIDRIQVNEPLFFRLMVAFHFSMAAASMRTNIRMPEGNTIPVNMYCVNLGPSNFGKTRASNIITKEVLDQFIPRFMEETFPIKAANEIAKISKKRAVRKQVDPDEELERVEKEFEMLGELVFSFDSGTDVAAKQLRQKLLMAKAGAINLIMDEVGLHITKNGDLLDLFMELYDGEVKTKLVKNTRENIRSAEIRGVTPANVLMFGTPNKLLDGSKMEADLMTMLESGYGRRCFYGLVKAGVEKVVLTPEESLNRAKAANQSPVLDRLSNQFGALADFVNLNKTLEMPEETALAMYAYKTDCEERAEKYKEHEDILKVELASRFFKAVKVAGAYAFVDGSAVITLEHFYAAVKLAEESGKAFESILKREKPHIKLAKYIANIDEEVTHADLIEELPYYPKSQSQRQELLNLAIAHGYKNNIIIKKSFSDGIEFLRGETLKPTNLDEMHLSYSKDLANGYIEQKAPFGMLHKLTQSVGHHWANHSFKNNHRTEENAIPGFNMVVIDVDGGVSLNTAKLLLKQYQYLIYTTKRHTEQENRFRIILPLNFELKLDAKDYKEFMRNVFEWLPFPVDDGTDQRSRKWLSHNGSYEYNEGELVDALPFIPKTSKNEERKKLLNDQHSLDNLERWVMNNTGDGNRNKMLLRYAMILVDSGFSFQQIRTKIASLNEKLPDPLTETELDRTVMVTVGNKLQSAA